MFCIYNCFNFTCLLLIILGFQANVNFLQVKTCTMYIVNVPTARLILKTLLENQHNYTCMSIYLDFLVLHCNERRGVVISLCILF